MQSTDQKTHARMHSVHTLKCTKLSHQYYMGIYGYKPQSFKWDIYENSTCKNCAWFVLFSQTHHWSNVKLFHIMIMHLSPR